MGHLPAPSIQSGMAHGYQITAALVKSGFFVCQGARTRVGAEGVVAEAVGDGVGGRLWTGWAWSAPTPCPAGGLPVREETVRPVLA